MKKAIVPKENLILRESRPMFFRNGEIWLEQLDGLYLHQDLLLEKFRRDLNTLRSPSLPSRIAVNLNETFLNMEIVQAVVTGFCELGHPIQKIVFTGLRLRGWLLLRQALRAEPAAQAFQTAFINDFEKAKQWLINQ